MNKRPRITLEQFFSTQFLEGKIVFCIHMGEIILHKISFLDKKSKPQNKKAVVNNDTYQNRNFNNQNVQQPMERLPEKISYN